MTDEPKTVTLTEDELNSWYEAKRKDEAMPDDEKKVRGIVQEEVSSALGKFFESVVPDDLGDDGKPKGKKNEPRDKGEPKGLFDTLAAWVGGE